MLDGELICLNDKGDPTSRACTPVCTRQAGRRVSPLSGCHHVAFGFLHPGGALDARTAVTPSGEPARRARPGRACWRTPRFFGAYETPAVLEATRERGFEGVVAKRLDSRCLPGARSAAWLKNEHPPFAH
jgi:bifunctional non-homologous end joining protein LigD